MEELGTPFVCTVNADGSPDFTLMPDPPKGADRNFAPAGRLIDPEKADQMVKDSVDRGTPTRETATGYAIAAMRMAELPPDTIQQVVAEMHVMIDKYSPAEAAQIATSSPYWWRW